jgi:phosphatidate cytidylyltransferase
MSAPDVAKETAAGARSTVTVNVGDTSETDQDTSIFAAERLRSAQQVTDLFDSAARKAGQVIVTASDRALKGVTSPSESAIGHVESTKEAAELLAEKAPTKEDGAASPVLPASVAISSLSSLPEASGSGRSQTPPSPKRSVSKIIPPTSSFQPSLPHSLPYPASNGLPINRKRKTPQDFSPSGPRDNDIPSSPSKLAVKFEDGLAPGEGHDGEKTMAKKEEPPTPKKDRNVIERTTWTFIMIGGFISEYA